MRESDFRVSDLKDFSDVLLSEGAYHFWQFFCHCEEGFLRRRNLDFKTRLLRDYVPRNDRERTAFFGMHPLSDILYLIF